MVRLFLYNILAVDALGSETDFTLELNRKKVNEKLLKTIQNSECYLLDLEFQTIKIQFFEAILKHVLGFQNHADTLQQKLDL